MVSSAVPGLGSAVTCAWMIMSRMAVSAPYLIGGSPLRVRPGRMFEDPGTSVRSAVPGPCPAPKDQYSRSDLNKQGGKNQAREAYRAAALVRIAAAAGPWTAAASKASHSAM